LIDAIRIVTTTGTRDDAQRIADALVERRLVACAQVGGPIRSTYRWQGEVHRDEEFTCTMKTARALYERVEQAIRQMHPYDEPEILATPIVAGSAGYLRWLAEQVDLS